MKKYISTKQIEAEPMTLGEACRKGLVKSEIGEHESCKLGYHTRAEYGYESWSPKELFEESYREVKEEVIAYGINIVQAHVHTVLLAAYVPVSRWGSPYPTGKPVHILRGERHCRVMVSRGLCRVYLFVRYRFR